MLSPLTRRFSPRHLPSSLLPALLALALSACGGSGGGDGGGGGSGGGSLPFAADTVAFLADGRLAGTMELWVSDDSGANARVVSGPLVPGSEVTEFAWSPNRQHLAFVSDRANGANSELYLANAAGGTPVRISAAVPPAWTDVHSIAWSADSTMVGYLADEDDLLEDDLFVGFVAGLPRERVSPVPGAVGGVVQSFQWQPGGHRLAYVGDVDIAGLDLLRIVDTSTGVDEIADLPGLGFGDVTAYAWSPNGTRIAYLFDTTTPGLHRTLHTVHAYGTDLWTLSDAAVTQADATAFAWSPNSVRIAWRTDEDTVGLPEIWAAGQTGTAKVKVGPAENVGLSVTGQFRWSPDSSKIAYVRAHSVTESELWVNATLGGSLTEVFGSNGFTNVASFAWSPDGQRLALRTDPDDDSRFELWVVGATGASPHQVSHDMPANGDVSSFAWIPGTTWILYVADEAADQVDDLFLAQAVGAPLVEPLLASASAASDVTDFEVAASPDGAFFLAGAGGTPRQLQRFVLGAGLTVVTDDLVPPLTDVPAFQGK